MNTIIVDNFFDNFNNIKDLFKNFQLFNKDEFSKKFGTQTWPGFRSADLWTENPILFNLIIKEIFSKFGNQPFQNKRLSMKSHIHLRLKEDNEKDWIHKDNNFATLMVFLSDTNLGSGTCLYDENKNLTHTINFVQNRALLFNSKIYHKSLNNYGDNLQNGRLTLNCFIDLN
jgi:hypothetical protein